MIALLTEKEIKLLEKKINEDQQIKDKIGVMFDDYKFYFNRMKEVLLPALKKYCPIKKKDMEI